MVSRPVCGLLLSGRWRCGVLAGVGRRLAAAVVEFVVGEDGESGGVCGFCPRHSE